MHMQFKINFLLDFLFYAECRFTGISGYTRSFGIPGSTNTTADIHLPIGAL